MLRLGLRSKPMTTQDMLPAKTRERDITDEMLGRFFPDIPDSQNLFRHGVVVGKPGCGKSELFKARAFHAMQKYGEDMNLVYTDDLRVGVAMMDARPVQYLIVDDASKTMSSRAVFEQKEILGIFNRLRHYHGSIGAMRGIVIVEFGWQRWHDLDPGFRDGTSLIFKTNMTATSERKAVEDIIGTAYMSRLDWIWDKMDQGDDKIKSLSVGRIGPKPIDHGGVGYYRHKMVDFPEFPEIRLAEVWLDNKGRFVNPVDNVDAMTRMAEIGRTHNEIATALGIGRSTVTKALIKAKNGDKTD